MDVNIDCVKEIIKTQPSEHDYQSTKSYNLRKRSCLKRSYDPSMWVTDEFYTTNNNATDFVSGTDPLSTSVPEEDLLDCKNVELKHETAEVSAEVTIAKLKRPKSLQKPARVLEETFESNSQLTQYAQRLGDTNSNTQFAHQAAVVKEEKEILFINCEAPDEDEDENGGIEMMAKFVAQLANLSKDTVGFQPKKKKLGIATKDYQKMLQELTMSPSLISQFQQWNLIAPHGSLHCEHGHTLKLRESSVYKDNFIWSCHHQFTNKFKQNEICSKRRSIRKNTFFEKSHLSIFQVVCFSYLWLENYSLKFICKQVKMSKKTAIDWACYHREVLIAAMDPDRQKIGGVNKIIEIGEFTFGNRKYYRGEHIEKNSVFGGIERDSGKCFIVPVGTTDKEVLLCIIQEWISPGTTLVSECWKTYNCLKDKRYQYLILNNSLIFQTPDKKMDTKYIKEMWLQVNDFLPKQSRKKRFFKAYLSKYVFLNNCKVDKVELLPQFFKYASELNNMIQDMETSDDETKEDYA